MTPAKKSRRKSRIVYVSVPHEVCEKLIEDADAATRTLSSQVLHIIRAYYSALPAPKA
jgi:CopG-like RHH_1 or ribbon-helix-helix domain, RHH_5